MAILHRRFESVFFDGIYRRFVEPVTNWSRDLWILGFPLMSTMIFTRQTPSILFFLASRLYLAWGVLMGTGALTPCPIFSSAGVSSKLPAATGSEVLNSPVTCFAGANDLGCGSGSALDAPCVCAHAKLDRRMSAAKIRKTKINLLVQIRSGRKHSSAPKVESLYPKSHNF